MPIRRVTSVRARLRDGAIAPRTAVTMAPNPETRT